MILFIKKNNNIKKNKVGQSIALKIYLKILQSYVNGTPRYMNASLI